MKRSRLPHRAGLLAAALAAAVAPLCAQSLAVAGDETALVRSYRTEAKAYEHGESVPRDGARAAVLYCKAARLGDAHSRFALGWMYANDRGVERYDGLAAFFVNAAGEQGLQPAVQMVARLPPPPDALSDCMREPPAVAVVGPPKPLPAAAEPAPRAGHAADGRAAALGAGAHR